MLRRPHRRSLADRRVVGDHPHLRGHDRPPPALRHHPGRRHEAHREARQPGEDRPGPVVRRSGRQPGQLRRRHQHHRRVHRRRGSPQGPRLQDGVVLQEVDPPAPGADHQRDQRRPQRRPRFRSHRHRAGRGVRPGRPEHPARDLRQRDDEEVPEPRGHGPLPLGRSVHRRVRRLDQQQGPGPGRLARRRGLRSVQAGRRDAPDASPEPAVPRRRTDGRHTAHADVRDHEGAHVREPSRVQHALQEAPVVRQRHEHHVEEERAGRHLRGVGDQEGARRREHQG